MCVFKISDKRHNNLIKILIFYYPKKCFENRTIFISESNFVFQHLSIMEKQNMFEGLFLL